MAERIVTVRAREDVQFLGVSGRQLSAAMNQLELKKLSEGVQVTSKAHPGKRYVVYNAQIAWVEYREEDPEAAK